jgi:hypothetical protein
MVGRFESGPRLRLEWPVTALPGHVFRASQGEALSLRLDAKLDSRDPVAALEIIQNGRVAQTVPFSEWKKTGSLGTVTFQESGWFLVRVMADVPNTFRFASSGPFYAEIGRVSRRVSRASAQFFLGWVRERMGQIKLDDPVQQEEVLRYHRQSEQFWQEKVAQATAE